MRKAPIYKLLIVLLYFINTSLLSQSIANSSVAFTISERDLLPESVGYDDQTKTFYVGSTRKGTIVKIDKEGKQSTFIESGAFGQWMIIGIKVDSERNELWFCSSGGGNLIGYLKKDETEGRPAGIFKVDLATGKLKKKYTLETEGEVHFFNDLVIDSNGNVYATHMFSDHSIYKIEREKDELEVFVESDILKYPNGMDISDDNQFLFVAHSEGIARVALQTGKTVSLDIVNDVNITHRESIDGLYFYKNTLIGVQSDLKRITQYQLSRPADAIMQEKELDINHPAMDHPTTGVLIDNEFYYVANAQFEKVNEDGSLPPMHELSEPTILKLKLEKE
ncbi:MAG: SMP-30/gluconolactonase/LRE family protein [Ekhidna sp.]